MRRPVSELVQQARQHIEILPLILQDHRVFYHKSESGKVWACWLIDVRVKSQDLSCRKREKVVQLLEGHGKLHELRPKQNDQPFRDLLAFPG
mmetsp:Transcript_21775/g.38071  ORF Transcript_21775/g.38071 Transcript_21775/m.38071 type:complete len:92 (-) Transcript_21775:406-681(-)